MGEFVTPFWYAYFYVAFIFVVISLKSLSSESNGLLQAESYRIGLIKTYILAFFFIYFFTTRPISNSLHMGDTSGYAARYGWYRHVDFPVPMNWQGKDRIWDYLYQNMSAAGFSVVDWFFVIAAVYVLCNVWGIKRLFPNHMYLVFLFYTTFFMFYQCGVNGIRNGMAISIVFLAISLLYKAKPINYITIILLMILAINIHGSVYITICALLTSFFLIKKTNIAILIWLCAIVIAIVAGNTLAEYMTTFTDDDRALRYLDSGKNAKLMSKFAQTGFRWDFLIFSAAPILLGWYVTVKRKINDKYYQVLLNTYIIANAVWVVFIYAAFTNRFAMLSWCLYPFVLCYPLIKLKLWKRQTQNRYTLLALWSMFVFTLFMTYKTH